MPRNDSESEASRAARALRAEQEPVGQTGSAAAAAYTLVGAIVGMGGLGYAIDYWRGTSPWFLVSGLFLGMVVGFYELIKITRQPR